MTVYIAKKDKEMFNIQESMAQKYIDLGYDIEIKENDYNENEKESKNGN